MEDMSHAAEHGAEGYGVRNCALSEREQVTMHGANTLEELADIVGYSGKEKETWLNSIKRYNEMCYKGEYTDYGKDRDALLPIDEPPFYACITQWRGTDWNDRRFRPYDSMGGLHADNNFNVVDANVEPIKGLYAAGNCLGYKYSVYYPTPCGGN